MESPLEQQPPIELKLNLSPDACDESLSPQSNAFISKDSITSDESEELKPDISDGQYTAESSTGTCPSSVKSGSVSCGSIPVELSSNEKMQPCSNLSIPQILPENEIHLGGIESCNTSPVSEKAQVLTLSIEDLQIYSKNVELSASSLEDELLQDSKSNPDNTSLNVNSSQEKLLNNLDYLSLPVDEKPQPTEILLDVLPCSSSEGKRFGESQSSTPVDQSSTPVDQSSTPVDQSSTPVDQASTPVDQVSTLLDKSSTLDDQSSTPVEQLSTPVDQSSTSMSSTFANALSTVSSINANIPASNVYALETTSDAMEATVELPEAAVDLPAAAVDLPAAAVDPPAATVDPPSATVDPPSATVDPLSATVDPQSATVDPPSATVDPPSATVDPPSATVDPPSATVDPPSATVDPPSATVDPPSATVDPPSATVDPPSATVDPPSATVYPLSATVDPPSATVYPLSATVDPLSATVDPLSATVDPLSATVDPLSATVDPLSATVDPLSATVDPLSATVDPLSATVDPLSATVDPLSATVDPLSATVDPPSATVDPLSATVEPLSATVDPPSATVDPPSATVDPPSATVDPPSATVDPPSATVDPSAANVDALASMSDTPAATVDAPAALVYGLATTADARPITADARPITADARPITANALATTTDLLATMSDLLATMSDSRKTTSGAQPTVADSRPTVADSRPTVADSRPTVADSRPTVADSRPTVADSRPTVADSWPTVADSWPTVADSRPTVADSRPTVADSRPTVADSRPTVADSRPTFTASRPSFADSRPTVAYSRPTLADSRPTTADTSTISGESGTISNQNFNILKMISCGASSTGLSNINELCSNAEANSSKSIQEVSNLLRKKPRIDFLQKRKAIDELRKSLNDDVLNVTGDFWKDFLSQQNKCKTQEMEPTSKCQFSQVSETSSEEGSSSKCALGISQNKEKVGSSAKLEVLTKTKKFNDAINSEITSAKNGNDSNIGTSASDEDVRVVYNSFEEVKDLSSSLEILVETPQSEKLCKSVRVDVECAGVDVQSVGPKVQSVGPKVQSVGPKVQSVGPKVQSVGPKVQSVGPKVQSVGPKVQNVGPKVQSVGPKVQSVGPKVQSVGPKVQSVGPNVQSVGPNVSSVSAAAENLQTDHKNAKPKNDFQTQSEKLCALLKEHTSIESEPDDYLKNVVNTHKADNAGNVFKEAATEESSTTEPPTVMPGSIEDEIEKIKLMSKESMCKFHVYMVGNEQLKFFVDFLQEQSSEVTVICDPSVTLEKIPNLIRTRASHDHLDGNYNLYVICFLGIKDIIKVTEVDCFGESSCYHKLVHLPSRYNLISDIRDYYYFLQRDMNKMSDNVTVIIPEVFYVDLIRYQEHLDRVHLNMHNHSVQHDAHSKMQLHESASQMLEMIVHVNRMLREHKFSSAMGMSSWRLNTFNPEVCEGRLNPNKLLVVNGYIPDEKAVSSAAESLKSLLSEYHGRSESKFKVTEVYLIGDPRLKMIKECLPPSDVINITVICDKVTIDNVIDNLIGNDVDPKNSLIFVCLSVKNYLNVRTIGTCTGHEPAKYTEYVRSKDNKEYDPVVIVEKLSRDMILRKVHFNLVISPIIPMNFAHHRRILAERHLEATGHHISYEIPSEESSNEETQNMVRDVCSANRILVSEVKKYDLMTYDIPTSMFKSRFFKADALEKGLCLSENMAGLAGKGIINFTMYWRNTLELAKKDCELEYESFILNETENKPEQSAMFGRITSASHSENFSSHNQPASYSENFSYNKQPNNCDSQYWNRGSRPPNDYCPYPAAIGIRTQRTNSTKYYNPNSKRKPIEWPDKKMDENVRYPGKRNNTKDYHSGDKRQRCRRRSDSNSPTKNGGQRDSRGRRISRSPRRSSRSPRRSSRSPRRPSRSPRRPSRSPRRPSRSPRRPSRSPRRFSRSPRRSHRSPKRRKQHSTGSSRSNSRNCSRQRRSSTYSSDGRKSRSYSRSPSFSPKRRRKNTRSRTPKKLGSRPVSREERNAMKKMFDENSKYFDFYLDEPHSHPEYLSWVEETMQNLPTFLSKKAKTLELEKKWHIYVEELKAQALEKKIAEFKIKRASKEYDVSKRLHYPNVKDRLSYGTSKESSRIRSPSNEDLRKKLKPRKESSKEFQASKKKKKRRRERSSSRSSSSSSYQRDYPKKRKTEAVEKFPDVPSIESKRYLDSEMKTSCFKNFDVLNHNIKNSITPSTSETLTELPPFEVIRLLVQVKTKVGYIGEALPLLGSKLDRAHACAVNQLAVFSYDDLMLLKIVNSKLDHILKEETASFVEKAILNECLNQLTALINRIHEENLHPKPFFDFKDLARKTASMSMTDNMSFIKNILIEFEKPCKDDDVISIFLESMKMKLSIN